MSFRFQKKGDGRTLDPKAYFSPPSGEAWEGASWGTDGSSVSSLGGKVTCCVYALEQRLAGVFLFEFGEALRQDAGGF